MSLSPDSISSSDHPFKRRKHSNIPKSTSSSLPMESASPTTPLSAQLPHHQQPQNPVVGSHAPKRGARACTACRKGKNRCEGEVSSSSALYTSPACAAALRPCVEWPVTPPGPASTIAHKHLLLKLCPFMSSRRVVDVRCLASNACLKNQRRRRTQPQL